MNIQGPAGFLEAEYDSPEQQAEDAAPLAILCHPHPQYGGSMHDAVLATTTRTLLDMGIHCLRFNFRGVGASAGTYDGGAGESQDLLAVHGWVQKERAEASAIYWAGYSFGANVVWSTLTLAEPDQVLLIAPPMAVMDFGAIPEALTKRISAVCGDQDDYADPAKLSALLNARAEVITGADHFFSGRHDELAAAVKRLLG